MKIGMISFAHIHAESYAKALRRIEGVEFVGIMDEDSVRGRKYSELFGTLHFSNMDEFLKQDMDAVIVTSENVHHKEHVLASAKAGKHVLCEKPISISITDAQEMIDVCKANHVVLQTAFPVRYNSSILRAKEMIGNGVLGDIIAVKGTNRGQCPGGWFVDVELSGGGAVLDHTVHVTDILRWFLGSEVRTVYAEIGNTFTNHLIDDSGILSMEFENGVFASLDCSWSRNATYPIWGDITLEIIGTKGTLSVDAFNQKLNVYSNYLGYNHSFWGDDMDEELIRDFVNCIRSGKKEAPITGEDGLRAIEVAFAAYESSKKKSVIYLN
ncbi:MAG: Gfo/Idh/MocA family oxidoreductase [Candidatus Cohnella colombiensis]|uniref:Gfo/Idh/MocA family oxidoreductase n=1 Tax=Candidatus Cohnella colombiensis TaxID=3121368 RepID=A0AA95JBX7_9BACL|nr:MAG: Gfo/Idh/MocA family oxidoreductase [Cohnella sp.]